MKTARDAIFENQPHTNQFDAGGFNPSKYMQIVPFRHFDSLLLKLYVTSFPSVTRSCNDTPLINWARTPAQKVTFLLGYLRNPKERQFSLKNNKKLDIHCFVFDFMLICFSQS